MAFLLLAGCAKKTAPRNENEIIRQMVQTYGNSPEKGKTVLTPLLEELSEVSPESAEKWESIMDYWIYANQDMALNFESLPDDLPDDDSLCIIVLGYQLNADGSVRPELEGRLQTALAAARQYPNAVVLCTGGGTASNNHSVTEAGEMANWLCVNGIASQRILVEDQSLSTVQNAKFSYSLLKGACPQVQSVVIATSDYHIPWGAVLFESQFLLAEEAPSVHVVSNAAYAADNHENYNILRYQTSGILELAGIK